MWLQHTTAQSEENGFTSQMFKRCQHGNVVPWGIKMRLGTKSLICLSAYGTIRSIGPSNPTKPNDFPLCLAGNQELNLWRFWTLGPGMSRRQWLGSDSEQALRIRKNPRHRDLSDPPERSPVCGTHGACAQRQVPGTYVQVDHGGKLPSQKRETKPTER